MAHFNDTIIRGDLAIVDGAIYTTDKKIKVHSYTGSQNHLGDITQPLALDGSHICLSSTNFGTSDPSKAISSPKTGQIYFKIIQ